MIKNFHILLFLICFFVINSNKISSRNLRNLGTTQVTLSEIKSVLNDNGVLKFEIDLSGSPNLQSDKSYNLKILGKEGVATATCSYSIPTLSCQYECGSIYYGPIKIPKNSAASGTDVITFSSDVTLQQTVELTYKNAVIDFGTISNVETYTIKVYVNEELSDNAFYQLDINVNNDGQITNCTYFTSSGFLSCTYKGDKSKLIQLVKERTNGSIKWKNDDTYDFDKTVLLNFEVKNILGYDLDFVSGKWTFKLTQSSVNIQKEGYHFTINVLLNKQDNSNVKACAICTTTSEVYVQTCEVEKIVEPLDGNQESSDFVYLSKDQAETTIKLLDDSLSENKIMPQLKTLTFVKVYDLKFVNNFYEFKIEISDTDLRNDLYVQVDLFRESDSYHKANCTINGQVLSCVRDKTSGMQDQELFYFSFTKNKGSVTWSNAADQTSDTIKIPYEVELTHSESYYLKFDSSKWTFRLKVSTPNHAISKGSLTYVDISYGSGQTTAECEANSLATKGYTVEFTCECSSSLTDSQIPQSIVNKNTGTVTWKDYTSAYPIAKKIEFNFVKAYDLTWTNSESKWSFYVDFTDPYSLNPTTSQTYSIDFSYLDEGTNYYDSKANCQLKADGSKTFKCEYSNGSTPKRYLLFIRTTKTVDSKTVNWIEGITNYYQMPLNAELTFINGTLFYNDDKWNLNISVTVPTTVAFPAKSKLIIDINKDTVDQTMECIAEKNLLKCQTPITSQSTEELPTYALQRIKSDSSTVTWQNTETDNSLYYFYLKTKLNFISADHIEFTNNKWQFYLSTSTYPSKTKIIIDVLYGGVASTATCIKDSTILCTVDNASQDKNTLVKINHNKSTKSTITWNNVLVDKDIIASTGLNVQSVKRLSYQSNNKWEFIMNIASSNLPLNSAVQIDIEYTSGGATQSTTATCILTEQTVLTCIPDVDNQAKTDTLTISPTKSKGSVSYISDSDSLIIQNTKSLEFSKVYDLTLNGNKWQFKVLLTDTNLADQEKINIDVKINGGNEKAECELSIIDNIKLLTCTITKKNSYDRLILINNKRNQDLAWSNLDEDIELYVNYYITFENVYGGFYENKWKFALKYTPTQNTIDAIGNYALLDILVSNSKNAAKCEITEKFLLCEFDIQTGDDEVKIYGIKEFGTVKFNNNELTEEEKVIHPIEIILDNKEIYDYEYSSNLILFKIKGNLNKDNEEFEIAEDTITGVEIVITQAAGTKNETDAICFTNNINNSPVILSCEASGTVKDDEDSIDIKVGSNGKSNYVTFTSTTENISVHKTGEETKPGEETKSGEESQNTGNENKGNKGNKGFLMESNYIFLIGAILLF